MTEMTMILDGGGAPKETDCWKATADGCRPLAGDVGACCTSFAHEKSCNATRPHGVAAIPASATTSATRVRSGFQLVCDVRSSPGV